VTARGFKWAKAKWAVNGASNSYRVGSASDVLAIDPDPRCRPAVTAIYAAVGMDIPHDLSLLMRLAETGGARPDTAAAAAPAGSSAGSALPATTGAAVAAMRDLVARSEEAIHTLRKDKAALSKDLEAARRGRQAAIEEQTHANQTVAALRSRVTELEGQLAAVLAAAARLDGAVAAAPELQTAVASASALAGTSAATASSAPSLARMESTRTRALGCCVICMDAPACMCPSSCGHVCVCEEDAERIKGGHCPICREAAPAMIRVFLVGGD
jgi:hypothetical protein